MKRYVDAKKKEAGGIYLKGDFGGAFPCEKQPFGRGREILRE